MLEEFLTLNFLQNFFFDIHIKYKMFCLLSHNYYYKSSKSIIFMLYEAPVKKAKTMSKKAKKKKSKNSKKTKKGKQLFDQSP